MCWGENTKMLNAVCSKTLPSILNTEGLKCFVWSKRMARFYAVDKKTEKIPFPHLTL